MLRRSLTFANVTSFLALFVALSAGSYAAIKLPANSVGSKQLKAKAVTNAKLGNRAVSGPKLQANAVDSSTVKDGSLTGSDINLATLGKVGSAAIADTAGAAPIARVKQVSAGGTSRAAASATSCPCPVDGAIASCDPGLVVVDGGIAVSDQQTQQMEASYPSSPNAWTGRVLNFGTGTPGFTVYAICAPAATTT
jgi:hypothetical protein